MTTVGWGRGNRWMLTEDSGLPRHNEVVSPKSGCCGGYDILIRKDLISSGNWYIANDLVAYCFQFL